MLEQHMQSAEVRGQSGHRAKSRAETHRGGDCAAAARAPGMEPSHHWVLSKCSLAKQDTLKSSFFFFLRLFLMWTVFKVFIEFVTIWLLFFLMIFLVSFWP